MAPKHQDLLANATEINRKIDGSKMPKDTGRELPTPPPADQLVHVDPNEDPFGGNQNNKRVAERIAKEKVRKYFNNSHPAHLGDPAKAAKDVAQSNRVNPTTDEDTKPVALPTVAQLPAPAEGQTAAEALAEKTEGKGKGKGKPAAGAAPAWTPGSLT